MEPFQFCPFWLHQFVNVGKNGDPFSYHRDQLHIIPFRNTGGFPVFQNQGLQQVCQLAGPKGRCLSIPVVSEVDLVLFPAELEIVIGDTRHPEGRNQLQQEQRFQKKGFRLFFFHGPVQLREAYIAFREDLVEIHQPPESGEAVPRSVADQIDQILGLAKAKNRLTQERFLFPAFPEAFKGNRIPEGYPPVQFHNDSVFDEDRVHILTQIPLDPFLGPELGRGVLFKAQIKEPPAGLFKLRLTDQQIQIVGMTERRITVKLRRQQRALHSEQPDPFLPEFRGKEGQQPNLLQCLIAHPGNVVRATMQALSELRTAEQIAELRGKKVEEL